MILLAMMFALAFALLAAQAQWEWRRALLGATTVVGVLVVLSCELLSIGSTLDADRLFVFWTTSLVVGLVVVTWLIRTPDPSWRREPEHREGTGAHALDWVVRAGICFLTLESLALLLVALLAPFDNWDSMTYHLSRVEHWRQEGTIGFFPTDTKRELHLAPWSEWLLLQFRLLSGNDRSFGLVQWLAFVLSVVSVSYAAKRLGSGVPGQVAAAIATATIPMAVLQATSTQNDLVAAMWASIAVAFAVDPTGAGRADRLLTVVFTGLSLGLAVLTKLSVVFFLAPFACWVALRWHRELGRSAWGYVAIVLTCAMFLNSGHLARTWKLYGTPLGPESAEGADYRLANEAVTLGVVGSNLVRNLGIHLTLPSDGWNRTVETGVRGLLSSLGLDPDDPRSTFLGEKFRLAPWNREDSAGNPIHLLLLSICFFLVVRNRDERALPLVLCLACGMVLFSAAAKWQPFHSRIHLPWFVLAGPLFGLALESRARRTSYSAWLVCLALVSVPYLVSNPARPLLGGASVLTYPGKTPDFRVWPQLEAPLEDSFEILRRRACRKLGIVLSEDYWEYPIWALAAQESFSIEIQHVAVRSEAASLVQDFRPCAVLVAPSTIGASAQFGGATFERVLEQARIALYLPARGEAHGSSGDRDQPEARQRKSTVDSAQ
jgi:4-amino-4-deoxy-L-arabinose transferase-like glycosyltransferase